MFYALLADGVTAFHFLYVAFVVLGELAILIGAAFRCSWARNPWFRCLHLAAVLIVAIELLLRIECPITTWESSLRRLAGQEFSGGSFVGRCLHSLIFHADEWTVTLIDAAVGLVVVLTFAVFPPRFRKARHS